MPDDTTLEEVIKRGYVLDNTSYINVHVIALHIIRQFHTIWEWLVLVGIIIPQLPNVACDFTHIKPPGFI